MGMPVPCAAWCRRCGRWSARHSGILRYPTEMDIAEIDTPALLVNLDVMECNLQRVGAYVEEHGLRLRPHTKTHKSPWVGKRQLESGAAGLTVAKVGEAEVMLGADPPDLLVAYPVIG